MDSQHHMEISLLMTNSPRQTSRMRTYVARPAKQEWTNHLPVYIVLSFGNKSKRPDEK